MNDRQILQLNIDTETKATTVTGFVYMDTGEKVCLDNFCLPFGGVAYTICEVKFL